MTTYSGQCEHRIPLGRVCEECEKIKGSKIFCGGGEVKKTTSGVIGVEIPEFSSQPALLLSDYQPTVRDRFAMAALTGFVAIFESAATAEDFAKKSYELADAMLEARKEKI